MEINGTYYRNAKPELKQWAARAGQWRDGGQPDALPCAGQPKDGAKVNPKARDVFVYCINGAKERAPAAAIELLAMLRHANAVRD